MKTLSERLAASEAMRVRLRRDARVVIEKHGACTPALNRLAMTIEANDALGYSDDAEGQGEDAARSILWKCYLCGTLVPFGERVPGPKHYTDCVHWQVSQWDHPVSGTPGDAAAAEEHAANDPPNEDTLPFQAGRIDACMEAVSNLRCKDDVIEQQLTDIRRRLDEPGESVEDEARWVASEAAKYCPARVGPVTNRMANRGEFILHCGAVLDGLHVARAAVRKERSNGQKRPEA